MKNKMSYEDAFNELQAIVGDIEKGDIAIDILSEKVKRAAFLIKFCRTTLTTTEEDVNEILRELDAGSGKSQRTDNQD